MLRRVTSHVESLTQFRRAPDHADALRSRVNCADGVSVFGVVRGNRLFRVGARPDGALAAVQDLCVIEPSSAARKRHTRAGRHAGSMFRDSPGFGDALCCFTLPDDLFDFEIREFAGGESESLRRPSC
jgi:hypothetical protein